MPATSASTPAPVIAEPKNTGCTERRPGLRRELARAAAGTSTGRSSSTYAASSASSCSASSSTSRPRKPASAGPYGVDDGVPGAEAARPSPSRTIAGVSFSAMSRSTRSYVGAAPVDLVHEEQRRDAQPLQRAHQHPGLRLHALDRRDHQHGAVEHAQHPLHLGDEVRVAGRVDQVDRDVVDDERHDGRLDRDAALAFQRQRVGLGAAVVDAADLVDDAGGVEQPLGQAGLTGVDVRQDPQVQTFALSVMSSR